MVGVWLPRTSEGTERPADALVYSLWDDSNTLGSYSLDAPHLWPILKAASGKAGHTPRPGVMRSKDGCPFTAVFCLNVFPLLIGRPFPTVKPQLPRNTNLIYRFLFVKKLWYEYANLAGAERDPGGLQCLRNFTVTN